MGYFEMKQFYDCIRSSQLGTLGTRLDPMRPGLWRGGAIGKRDPSNKVWSWQLSRVKKNSTDSLVVLQTDFKDDDLGKAWVYDWFSGFEWGETTIGSVHHSTSRTDDNVEKIDTLNCEDRSRTIEQLSHMSEVS
ncbi:hypothetical protein JTB14_030445 [Gonioctena quinquepunctata]|nr:hypothetical protein JTB14_030445 [Gonioctena quinquepunctata]